MLNSHIGNLLAAKSPLEEIASKTLFTVPVGPWQFPFTNHMLMIMLASLVLITAIPLAMRRQSLVPKGLTNVVETICVFIREDMARPFLKDQTDRFIGILWTLFFFILTMNLLGLMPLSRMIWAVTGRPNEIGGAATGNLWVTGALATFAFFLFHIAGIREKGFWHYLATLSPKVPWPLMPIMFVLELVSSFVRLFSLAIRLFANIMAGHILLATLLGFIIMFKNYMVATASITMVTAMSLLEIFVAFLQAYIFVFLTAIFIGFAISEEH